MNNIGHEQIKEIREKADIVSIISNYVSLVPKGKNYFGICPFHDDNHPSMSVNPEKKIYKCFSCGATGTVFKFLMDFENISFYEAVQEVASTIGIKINAKSKKKKQNTNLNEIYDISLKYYINNINTSYGKEARNYLKKRQLDKNIIKEFQIGLSLSNNDLSQILTKKYSEEDLLKSGLIGKNPYGYYEIFKDRIMFPLWNLDGQAVAYSGRIYNKQDDSKYINTTETEIFQKGKILYNYHRAKKQARAKNKIIVVEGFMDVIRLYTIGIENVVAPMGTAVTKDQANLIKKMAKEVILCFDGDKAGAKATSACGDLLIEMGVTPKVIRLPDNQDPDEYILKNGEKAYKNLLDNPKSFTEFKMNYLKEDKNLQNAEDEANYVNEVIKEIEKIKDDTLREITIQKLAAETNIDEKFIKNKLEYKPVKRKKITIKTNKYEIAQRNLIYYMLNYPKVIEKYNKQVTYIPSKDYRWLAREINQFYEDNGFIEIADFMDYTQCDTELLDTLKIVTNAKLSDEYTEDEIDDYIKTIQEYNINNETKRLQEELKKETDTNKKLLIAQKIVELKKL